MNLLIEGTKNSLLCVTFCLTSSNLHMIYEEGKRKLAGRRLLKAFPDQDILSLRTYTNRNTAATSSLFANTKMRKWNSYLSP